MELGEFLKGENETSALFFVDGYERRGERHITSFMPCCGIISLVRRRCKKGEEEEEEGALPSYD